MRLTCLGGAGEVGANSYYLRTGGVGLILDAGLHPKKQGPAALPRFDAIDDHVDHILITHAHLDHVGALPRAMQRFPHARIHMTRAAFRFAARMLRNGVNVMRRRFVEEPNAPPLWGFEVLDDLDDLIEMHDEGVPFSLGRGVRATFVSAGHIPGAAGTLIENREGRRFFYTGDTCGSEQLLLPAAIYPTGRLDVLLTETTYGANLVADGMQREDVTARFAASITRVLERGGLALVPVFALGRAQELLYALWQLTQQGLLPRVPVYLTGLARALTRIYDETRRETPRRDPGLKLEGLGFRTLDDATLEAGGPEGPAIVLASSGMMLPKTLSNRLARRVLVEERDALYIVGYQDPESPGFRVQHAQIGDAIDLADGLPPVERRCPIERYHFRAHSSRGELLTAARAMRPELSVLVHGDPTASDSLGQTLEADGARVLHPAPATPYEL